MHSPAVPAPQQNRLLQALSPDVQERIFPLLELMVLMLRYTQSLITQMAQTAVCNRHHSIDQQLCRWLLLSLDRLQGPDLVMTQELIANMLGVRREGVTDAAGKLQKLGIIEYSRGKIKVLDRPGLERRSCECYGVAYSAQALVHQCQRRDPRLHLPPQGLTLTGYFADQKAPPRCDACVPCTHSDVSGRERSRFSSARLAANNRGLFLLLRRANQPTATPVPMNTAARPANACRR